MPDSSLRLSIVIPAPTWKPDWPALKALSKNPPRGSHEIILAIGNHPSIQRNEAIGIAKHEIIVFLDSDAAIEENYWEVLEKSFQSEEVKIVGGPSLLERDHTFLESIFQGLLTHKLVVGPMADRYKAAPFKERASQQDLILCNLAAREEVFKKIGLFSPALFPNEENEWMDRATAAGKRMVYEPRLQVFRPQRKTLYHFLFTMIRYGIGRTQQFRVAGVFALPMILPILFACGIILLGLGFAIFGWRISLGALFLGYGLLAILQGSTSLSISEPRPSFIAACLIGLIGPVVPMAYALGQIMGWFVDAPKDKPVSVCLVNEKNEPLKPGISVI